MVRTIPRTGSLEVMDALDLGVSPEVSPRDVAQRRAGMLRKGSAFFEPRIVLACVAAKAEKEELDLVADI